MGVFSWKTSDTNKSISNRYSSRGPLPVFLITPDNTAIREVNYEGYGIFGGKDAYALLAQWNKPELCNGKIDHDRDIGIDIAFGDGPIKFPLKFAEEVVPYSSLEASESCEDQGHFYDDEENDSRDGDNDDDDDD